MPILEQLISILAPHRCLGCGMTGEILCANCQMAELSPPPPRCYRCRAMSSDSATCRKCRPSSRLSHVWVGSDYLGLAERLVRFIKFERGLSAAEVMAAYLSDNLPVIPGNAVVVHVPTASSRVRRRGYDQSKMLARALAKKLNLPHQSVLMRVGQARQVGTKRQQRLKQLESAYRVINSNAVKGAYIILVDDVVTTGATLEAAAKILKQAGARKVDAAVFAQA